MDLTPYGMCFNLVWVGMELSWVALDDALDTRGVLLA